MDSLRYFLVRKELNRLYAQVGWHLLGPDVDKNEEARDLAISVQCSIDKLCTLLRMRGHLSSNTLPLDCPHCHCAITSITLKAETGIPPIKIRTAGHALDEASIA